MLERFRRILRRTLRVIGFTVLAVCLVLVLALLALRTHYIQNLILPVVENALSSALETKVKVASVWVDFPAEISLNGIQMDDQKGVPMISMDALKISAFETGWWNWILNPDSVQHLRVAGIHLEHPEVFLYKSRSDSVLNLTFLTESEDTSSSALKLGLELSEISITDAIFTYTDSTKPDLVLADTGRLNFANIRVHAFDGILSFAMDASKKMQIGIDYLTLKEELSDIYVDTLALHLTAGQDSIFCSPEVCEIEPYINVRDLNLGVYATRLKLNARFFNEPLAALFDSDWNEVYEVQFGTSVLDKRFIDYFLPKPLPFNGIYKLYGHVKASPERVSSKDLFVAAGKQTFLRLKFRLTDYTDPDNMFIDASVDSSRISLADVNTLVPGKPVPDEFEKLGVFGYSGYMTGFLTDFVSDAVVTTQFGNIIANVNLKLPPRVPVMAYSGSLQTQNLNLNAMGISQVLKSEVLNFNGNIQGKGVTFKEMDAAFDGYLVRSDLFGYMLDSLVVDHISVKNRILQGKVRLTDHDGNADLGIECDLSRELPYYQLKGAVQKLDLRHYGIVKNDSILFTTKLDIKMEGDSIENLFGRAKAIKVDVFNVTKNRHFIVSNFLIRTSQNSMVSKNIKIESSILNGILKANMSFEELGGMFARLGKEFTLYASGNTPESQEYYQNKQLPSRTLSTDFNFRPGSQTSEFFEFAGIKLSIPDSATFHGVISTGETDIINLNVDIPLIRYDEMRLVGLNFNSEIVKNPKVNDDLIASGNLKSDSLFLTPEVYLHQIDIEHVFSNNTVEYTLAAKQDVYKNSLRLVGDARITDAGIAFRFKPSVSKIINGGQVWVIDRSNQLTWVDSFLVVKDLSFRSGSENIDMQGKVGKLRSDSLLVHITNLRSQTIASITGIDSNLTYSIQSFSVAAMAILGNMEVVTTGQIQDITYYGIRYGNLTTGMAYADASGMAKFTGMLSSDNQKIFDFTGGYATRDTLQPLDATFSAYDLPLEMFQPFVEPNITSLKGKAGFNGFRVSGSPDKLQAVGEGMFSDVSFKVDYLKSSFSLKDSSLIRFNERFIHFPELVVYDEKGMPANFSGKIFHSGFKDFRFDLQLSDMNHFQVMNTGSEDNSAFYGTVILRQGIGFVTGNLQNINLDLDLVTDEGTSMNIPLSGYGKTERPDFIRFVGPDNGIVADDTNRLDIQGINLRMRLYATPDATCRVIFDEKVGDVIEVQGEGTINMDISTLGDFSMSGTYMIQSGNYLFTSQNIVNKNFIIEPGGKLIWSGDPYDAYIDIKAKYRLQADISAISVDRAKKRVPVNVLMNMQGSLLKPYISLAIQSDVTQEQALELVSLLRNAQNDEKELNRQVVSLLIFGRFAPPNNFFGEGSGAGITSSISELISNQVNLWLTQTFGGFGDNLDLRVKTDNFQQVDLDIQANLFGDKVLVERNGTIIGNRNRTASVGNISILIKLLPPVDPTKLKDSLPYTGQLVFEIFNRENTAFTNANNQTTGGGLFFKKDFDKLTELLMSRKQREEQRLKLKL